MPSPSPTVGLPRGGAAATVAVVAWRVGVVAAAAAVAVVAAELVRRGLPVLVLGPTVLHQVQAVLTLASISLLALALSGMATFDRPRRRPLPRLLVGLTTAAAVLAAPVAALVSLMVADEWTVIDRPSPTGCRVVAAEYSFLLATSHRGYTLTAGAHVVDAAREPDAWWVGDDGYQPVSAGRYELTWRGETATLSFPVADHAWFVAGPTAEPRHQGDIAC
jgi:hypothetical protein